MFKKNLYRESKHILHPINVFFETRAVYGIMWKNIVEPDRP